MSLRGVQAGYLPDRPVLHGLDLAVAPGESVALIGPSGSGKSTIITLLLRMLDPTEGSVLLHQRNVRAQLGQQLVTARSGREALRHMLHQDFAAVLLDVVMPEMDGFETAMLIREREKSRNTPILFLTALLRGEVPEFRAYAVGAVDYLLKP